MPSFRVEDVDIEIEEFWYECSEREKQELVELIKNDGYLWGDGSLLDSEWAETCEKLGGLRLRLSLEEQELIESIVKKHT